MSEIKGPGFIAQLPPQDRAGVAAKFHTGFAQHLEQKSQMFVGTGVSDEYKKAAQHQREVAGAQTRGGPTEASSQLTKVLEHHQDLQDKALEKVKQPRLEEKRQEKRKSLTDWRLQYIVDYFIPSTAKWEVDDQNNLEIRIPIVYKERGQTELSFNINGDNLVRSKPLEEQSGPLLEYQPTDAQKLSNESGFNILVDTFSLSLPGGKPQDIKGLRPENKRFQDMKFLFWPANHVSYVDSSIYYPRVNTIYTPFPTTLPVLMGIGHESGHCIDSEKHPDDYQMQESDLKKSKKTLLMEQVPKEERAWQEAKGIFMDMNAKGASKIDETYVDKYINFYLGNYQIQAEEALDI